MFYESVIHSLKERAGMTLQALEAFKALAPSAETVTYSFLSLFQQIQSIIGPAFMANFDYKSIQESVSVLVMVD